MYPRKSTEAIDKCQIITEQLRNSAKLRKYSKGRFLGKGGFARVYEVLNLETKEITAAKVISKASLLKSRTRQKLMSEIKIHRSLSHKNIVTFTHYFEDSENVYILLELCPNQTLNELLRRRKRLTELETQCYLFQAISALQYLHSNKVIHRDIKLGNLFLSEKLELKLGDFGLAAKMEYEGERKRTICGTPNYIAPEILGGREGHSFGVDVWSLGVLAYTLLIGKPPFETTDIRTTYRKIRMNAYSFPDHVLLSDEAKALVSSILQTDPRSRPSLSALLHSPFFTRNSIPASLPTSTLAVPPSASFVEKYVETRKTCKTERTRHSSQDLERENRTKPANRPISCMFGRPLSLQNSKAKEPARKRAVEDEPQGKRVSFTCSYPGGLQYPTVWVQRWVDYSSKYGLGYALSSGCIGVHFNDSSKIIGDSEEKSFDYSDRSSEEQTVKYSLSNYPAHLKKKVTLLEHFRKHLTVTVRTDNTAGVVYVKKWAATAHATFFRLSNKLVQVSFQDKTELLLCSESKSVVYVKKNQELYTCPLHSAMDAGNPELAKRLRYTKEILTSMFQSKLAPNNC